MAILTNEAPAPPRGTSPILGDFGKAKGDVDMQDLSSSFPVTNFYELENRVFKDDWSIPYRQGYFLIAHQAFLRNRSINFFLAGGTSLLVGAW